MPATLTPEQCRARAMALKSAADHLLHWTTDRDPVKTEQGDVVHRQLKADSDRYNAMAMAREFKNLLLGRKF